MFVSPLNVPFVFHFFPYSSSNKHIVDFNIFCHRYVLKNLKLGEAVVIVDYKMKLELGMHAREIQQDWYGKRGISLHGFYVIAQVGPRERRIEVLVVWS